MKIHLIYPPKINHIFGVTYHSFIDAEAGYYPPIGLLYIAAALRKNAAHAIRIIDCVAEHLSHDALQEMLRREAPDVVGIYTSTHYLYDTHLLAKNVKAINPGTVVIVGGPHVSLYCKESIDIPYVDIAVAGEGEEVFPRIIAALEQDAAQPRVEGMPGVITKKNRDTFVPPAEVKDLDALAFPARDLTDVSRYRSILARRNPVTTVISSRGCPFKCKFCSNLESGHKVRFRSARSVADELEECVQKYNIRDFLFFDELFTTNKKRVLEICDEIEKRELKIRWHCRSRADVVDEEMIQRMKKAGCRLIQFGIETGSPRLQKYINKNLDLEKVRKLIRMIYDHGILTYGDFMIGLPTETPQETQATIDYARSLRLDYAIFGMFGPNPGSDFYDEGLSRGYFNDFWRAFVISPAQPIDDYSWSRKDAPAYYKTVSEFYTKFYVRPSYILRRIARTDSFSQMAWQVQSGIKIIFGMLKKFYAT